ncbi:MAG TPA: hypothetical protein DCE42_27500 [Myxococcales bacterium]|nr:hypothetical protein [Deltaproteobacteria bacterium]MBU52018.1 hypothetical protein [Deltaproteobacteria bacterium]HAA58539.1 hypothetical protein [Myxococcales bacterium]
MTKLFRLCVLSAIAVGLLVGGQQTAWAKKRAPRCHKKTCFKWNARKKRCTFSCKLGHMCYEGKCYKIKKCQSARCLVFIPKRGCVSRCPGQICDRGLCRRRKKNRCYDAKRRRFVKRCPRRQKCVRGRCRKK